MTKNSYIRHKIHFNINSEIGTQNISLQLHKLLKNKNKTKMKKAIFFLAAITILFAACDYTSKKPSSTATDSTMVLDTAMPIIDTVTLESDSAR